MIWEGNAGLRRLLVPVVDLRAHPKNPRRGNVAGIQESLTRFGQQRPLLALPDGTIVAGNHTYRAAVENGWTHVAVVRSDLPESDVDAYLAADNRLSDVGSYDDEALANLLRGLRDGEDGLYGTGYDDGLVDRLLKAAIPPEADDVPEIPPDPKSKPGEVYEIGPHRLMCGDATDPDALDTLLAGSLADLLLTDPPYGVHYGGGAQQWSTTQGKRRRRTVLGDQDAELYAVALPLLRERTRPDGAAYVWFADSRADEVYESVAAAGFTRRCVIIWAKQRTTGAIVAHYIPQHEPLLYLSVGSKKAPRWFGPTNESTLWEHPRPAASELHPTQKPVALFERAIRNSSKRGESVLDPFAGSGTAMIAAEQTDRRCLAMEIDPGYCDVIRQRYADYTGIAVSW